MIKAFIFDLDGTLMDSEVLWVEALELVVRDKSRYISHEDAMAIVYGKSWSSVYSDVEKRFPGVYPDIDEMEILMREKFLKLAKTRDVLIHSSIDLLKKLSKDYPVCIVSGGTKKDVTDSIKLMGITHCLKFYLTNEDCTVGKPDPSCYLAAADQLHLPPQQCLVFEDSAAGIQAAKKAGMYCVALKRKNTPNQDTSEADETLEDLSDFRIERWA
jgi:HAD superfamily hydrolase (TIGR01509 family)